MDLILWRHAEARDGSPDLTRPLTRKGGQQAKEMAEFLNLHLAKNTLVWTSEATRSIETAAYLNRTSHVQAALNPTCDSSDILPLLLAQHKQPLLVVGHQPWLGHIWEHCMTGSVSQGDYWSVKKGSVVWLKLKMQADGLDCKLVAALSPVCLGVI